MKTDVWYDYLGKKVRITGTTQNMSTRSHKIMTEFEVKTDFQAMICKYIEAGLIGDLKITDKVKHI